MGGSPGGRSGIRRAAAAAFVVVLLVGTILAIEARSVARLDSVSGDLPVRLYSRPPMLVLGQPIDVDALEAHLSRVGYTRVREGAVGAGQFAAGRREWVIVNRRIARLGPLASGQAVRVRLDRWNRVTSLEDREGQRYRAVPLEPELIAVASGERTRDRTPVRLAELPPHLLDAVLTVEDQRFYRHRGLDYVRIGAAALANMRDGRIVQGGSTITQQLARSLFLDSRRTFVRKAREAAMALTLESRYSKDRILEAYLNEVYLGQEGGLAIHGVGRAAEVYFGKDASHLDLAESALLAGLIRGPNLYSPSRRPEVARARRDLVLRLMAERGVIAESDRLEASTAPLPDRARGGEPPRARYYADYVLRELGANDLASPGGRTVITSLDPQLQRVATAAVSDGLAALESEHPGLVERSDASGSALQAALVAVDPRTGDVLAMVGGRDYGSSQYNRAAHARRQPGSSFKPIVTLSALAVAPGERRDGSPITLATVLSDEPLEVETPAGPWQPINYDGRFHGQVTLREALERSLNVPFARLGLEVGAERIVSMARRVGIDSRLKAYPSIALGAFEVTPLEMARAYGVLAAGGYRAGTRPVLAVLGPDGEVSVTERDDGERAASESVAYLVTSALRGAVERGTGRSLRAHGFSGAVAAKSGTTNGFRDGWFIGYTPTLAVAVWVGFDDGQSLGLPGSRVALPVFARFMASATGRYGDEGPWANTGFDPPAGLEVVDVNPETGLRAGPGCPGRPEIFVRGTAPRRSCSPYGYYSDWRADGNRYDVLRRLAEVRARRDR
ncbi:MAG: PBP1A family penicillin-binding protein [marine benthic group bacterium]|nr:PBP1A family penicillin-binding protein [Gemmatimonadota bacterium]